ncbi:hypothetical protein ONS95_000111 [Cadophora gregata]|uniref:uncharacterized protein n=1 Tax=Cadophora gregata TaxID=51156 RepID=UPI0026DBACE2|nr:uncharacterized protein ONS95_000111 [Cadophora gregata]KAK0115620.1 hypothetical protein ONS96_014066 [Cadophora gregata f. sp. sojae]KAK0128127.1 hypothetical protein ONS95_000111 [Cadophora gregata]
MEIHTLELTEEDILSIHRYYITCLYLEDKKTDVEIVAHLYEQYKLQITLTQIRKCIEDWKLELPVSLEPKPEEQKDLDSDSDGSWVVIPSTTAPSVPTNKTYTPSDPKLMSLYTKRPLPSLPTSKSSPKMDSKSRVRKRQAPNTDKVKGVCHHGGGSSDTHEVETTLTSVPNGPTQMELYVDDDQDYERVAQGLRSSAFARAGQYKEGMSRHHSVLKLAKRPMETSRDKKDKGKGKGKAIERQQRRPTNEQVEREMSHES